MSNGTAGTNDSRKDRSAAMPAASSCYEATTGQHACIEVIDVNSGAKTKVRGVAILGGPTMSEA
eukprot:13102-Eustigmatos_ZCMA.PRE.1